MLGPTSRRPRTVDEFGYEHKMFGGVPQPGFWHAATVRDLQARFALRRGDVVVATSRTREKRRGSLEAKHECIFEKHTSLHEHCAYSGFSAAWYSDDHLPPRYPKCGTTWMQQIVLLLRRHPQAGASPMKNAPWIENVRGGRKR